MPDTSESPRQRRRRRRLAPESDGSTEAPRSRLLFLGGIAAASFIFAVGVLLVVLSLSDDDDSTTATIEPTAVPEYQLKLESANCRPTQQGMQIDGSVTNISDVTFADVAVVGVFLDAQGAIVARAVGELTSSFPPGDSLPFNVSAAQPGLASCVVTFYLATGEKLVVDESVIPDETPGSDGPAAPATGTP